MGKRLVEHADTHMVAFTGGIDTGRAVAEACGRLYKRTLIETSGNDPFIVMPSKFGNFLALIGVAFAPLCGIQIVDYFILRRGHIELRALYIDAPGRPYYYWRGINPAALIALAAGCPTYVAFLNPLTYESMALYPYLTASLPAAAVAALVYFLGSLAVIRAGRGGYPRGYMGAGVASIPESKL